jgi:hypothetical protein
MPITPQSWPQGLPIVPGEEGPAAWEGGADHGVQFGHIGASAHVASLVRSQAYGSGCFEPRNK